jgi:hypothetical protein
MHYSRELLLILMELHRHGVAEMNIELIAREHMLQLNRSGIKHGPGHPDGSLDLPIQGWSAERTLE